MPTTIATLTALNSAESRPENDGDDDNNDESSSTKWVVNVGGYDGYLERDRLVVQLWNHSLLFFHDGQTKLCKLLDSMKNDYYNEYKRWSQQTNKNRSLLSRSLSLPSLQLPPLLNMTVDCSFAQNPELGQGNWIVALYMARMAAARQGVDLGFYCHDGNVSQRTLLLPWFQGLYHAPPPPRHEDHDSFFAGGVPSRELTCTKKYRGIRIHKMAKHIQRDVRNIALRVIKQLQQEQHDHDFVFEPDDVAIHFRCGDIMGGIGNRNDYGILHFGEYKKWIRKNKNTNNTITSVGIITHPFDSVHNLRPQDRATHVLRLCKRATFRLVDYLLAFLGHNHTNTTNNNTTTTTTTTTPHIRIWNGPNETLPLAYARLTMARQQSFCSLSSFGIFPVMATFGEGYFLQGKASVTPFAEYLPQVLPNLHMMSTNTTTVIPSGTIFKKLKLGNHGGNQNHVEDQVLDWFVSEKVPKCAKEDLINLTRLEKCVAAP